VEMFESGAVAIESVGEGKSRNKGQSQKGEGSFHCVSKKRSKR
jgi:hypothetical protein